MRHERLLDLLWLLLMGLTLISAWIAESAEPGLLVTLVIAAVIMVKGRIIVDDFMELRTANRFLRHAMNIYFYVIPAMIVLVYLFPEQLAELTRLSY